MMYLQIIKIRKNLTTNMAETQNEEYSSVLLGSKFNTKCRLPQK